MKRIKKFLENNILTKKMYYSLYLLKHRKEYNRMRDAIQNRGIETIGYLQSILENLNVPFFFDMGTLLGIVREGRLLGHDLDVDIAVLNSDNNEINNIVDALEKKGCKHKFRYIVENIGVVEDSFLINDIKFDINYYHQNDKKDTCYLGYKIPSKIYEDGIMNVVKLECKHIENTKKISFGKYMINVPEEPELYLAERYGTNWRIPDKNYVYWKGPSATAIENEGKQIVY